MTSIQHERVFELGRVLCISGVYIHTYIHTYVSSGDRERAGPTPLLFPVCFFMPCFDYRFFSFFSSGIRLAADKGKLAHGVGSIRIAGQSASQPATRARYLGPGVAASEQCERCTVVLPFHCVRYYEIAPGGCTISVSCLSQCLLFDISSERYIHT